MAQASPPGRRISSATIALAAAALLATAAVAVAVFRSGDAMETATPENADAGQGPSMGDAVASLEEQLRRDPDNHGGWHLLGLAHRDVGRLAQAEQAFRRAMELAPRNADYVTYVAETLLLMGSNDESERLFRRALELEPENPAARYYLATLRDIRGEHQGAVDDLIAMLDDVPAGAPWEGHVRQTATAIARERNIDIDGRLPPPRPAPATAQAAIPGPTREQMEAARAIPPSQQQAMVQDMVERLANRLRQNPRNADGWIQLMRSRMVLNEPEAAREALRSGLAAFADDATTQQRLRTAAGELAVPTG